MCEPAEVQAVCNDNQPEQRNEDFVSGHGDNVYVGCDRFEPSVGAAHSGPHAQNRPGAAGRFCTLGGCVERFPALSGLVVLPAASVGELELLLATIA